MWSRAPSPGSFRRWTRLLTLVAAIAGAELIWLIAESTFGLRLQAPAGTVAAEPVDITPLTLALAGLFPSLLGWGVLATFERWWPRAVRVWPGLGLVVFAASLLLGALGGSGVSATDRLVLGLMHLVVAATVILGLWRTSDAQLRRAEDDGHMAHRPPVHSNPEHFTPPLVFGTLYPEHDIVAVIDDVEQARRAEAALHVAGIPQDDSDVLEPGLVLEAMRDIDRRRGRLGRLAAALSSAASDDSAYMRGYAAEAQRGHSLLVVHAPTPAVVEQVRQVLNGYGARAMRHYERFAVTDLH